MRKTAIILALILLVLFAAPSLSTDCHTDAECALLCSEADRQLPPDHPLYCDGGPSDSEQPTNEKSQS